MPLHFRPTRSGISLAVRYSPGKALPSGAVFTRNTPASYTTATGLLMPWSAGVNAWRDAHYVGAVRTLMIEPASTNIAPQSNPNAAGWALFTGLDQGAVVGPDGVAATGRQWHQNSPSADSALYFNTTPAAGGYWVASYVRIGNDGPQFRRTHMSYAAIYAASVDHLTSAVWTRYSDLLAPAAIVVNIGWRGWSAGNGLSAQCAAYQVEAQGTLLSSTSHIPTAGAPIGRGADILTFPRSGTLYEKYLDHNNAPQESVRPYVAASAIGNPNAPRYYTALKLALGNYSLVQMRNA